MKLDKRGQSVFSVARKTIYWMIAGFVISLIVIAVVGIIWNYTDKLTIVPEELEGYTISSRFLQIPECFAYQDPVTERVYSGVIDLSKFTQERLDACYTSGGRKEFNFRLHLRSEDRTLLTNNYFDNYKYTTTHDVVIYDGTTFQRTVLEVRVQPTV
jgi:hypothetical protein